MEQPNYTRASLGPLYQPPMTRSTSCVVIRLKKREEFFIAISLSSRSDTQILSLDPISGRLQYSGKENADLFSSEAEALDHLSDREGGFEILERGCALLGYVPIGTVGTILLATRVRTAATLPGGHQIRLVAECKWIWVHLQGCTGAAMTQSETERVENLENYTLNNAHYFCETADVTRAFPSRHPVAEPCWEFVWNRWLARPLRELGLDGLCPHLLQGVVDSRVLQDANFSAYVLILLSRRSRLHPGMRYIARGLNSLASPGNEIECEQLICTCPSEKAQPLRWSSYAWRRGTVPIWWAVELKSGGVGEATINVNARNPYRGTRRYFRRLQKRYTADVMGPTAEEEPPDEVGSPSGASAASFDASADAPSVPITCCNLLRCSMQRRDELLLSEHFSEGVRRVRKKLPGVQLRVLNFDWHGMLKDLKEQGTVEGLWTLLESVLPQTSLSVGLLQAKEGGAFQAPGSGRQPVTEWSSQWQVCWSSQQNGVVRYNCADSLDRTNAASYFTAVQVLAEQARQLGLQIENREAARGRQSLKTSQAASKKKQDLGGALEISSIHQRVRNMMKAQSSQAGSSDTGSPQLPAPLPLGWEERVEPASGRTFFIDHNTKKTTWERPQAEEKLEGDAAHLTTNSGSPAAVASLAVEVSDNSATEITKQQIKWGLLGLGVPEVRQRLRADVVAAQAEIFLINGDINSNLYTSTRAMHSAILGLLQGESSAVSKAGVGRLANLGVTLQRRWANVLSDATRQVVVECFLGLRLKEHFPNLKLVYGGEEELPLDESSNESDTEEALSDVKVAFPPDLVNQANLKMKDPSAAGDTAPMSEIARAAESDPGSFVSPAAEAGDFQASVKHAQYPPL